MQSELSKLKKIIKMTSKMNEYKNNYGPFGEEFLAEKKPAFTESAENNGKINVNSEIHQDISGEQELIL